MTALIILDLLEDFFDTSLWPKSEIPAARTRLVENTNALSATCRAAGMPVLWFRQEFREDLSDAFPHMRKNGLRYTIAGTPGCELLAELRVTSTDHVLLKSRFSGFYQTTLEVELQRLDVHSVILAGITTAWCVRCTAADAYQRDLEVMIAADCVAAFTGQAHREAVAAMDGYIATFLSNEELAMLFDRAKT